MNEIRIKTRSQIFVTNKPFSERSIGTCVLPMIYRALKTRRNNSTFIWGGIKFCYNPENKVLSGNFETILDVELKEIKRALICLELAGEDIEWIKSCPYVIFVSPRERKKQNEKH